MREGLCLQFHPAAARGDAQQGRQYGLLAFWVLAFGIWLAGAAFALVLLFSHMHPSKCEHQGLAMNYFFTA